VFRVSIDVGGTFTDLVALDEESGELLNIKVPSIPRSPEKGVTDAMRTFFLRESAPSVRMIGHATTIATNALLGQTDLELPKTALITTRGFRDVVEIGRQRRAEVYNLFFRRPPMLVERRLRYEVEERTDSEGNVLVPLNRKDVETALDEVEEEGVAALVVGFINSYANSSNEEEALRIVRKRLPHLHAVASSRISNEYREYERLSTAIVNAVLMPIIDRYISRLASDLKGLGIDAPFYMMQSNGGVATPDVVAERPATIVESGPASGVIAASWLGEVVGESEIISFDMGGTTAKAGAVRGHAPEVLQEYEVAGRVHMGRLVKGSGYPVRYPFIDLAECSAGGGTIARVDEAGALLVGPVSAGADPGPACYGRGGTRPTITDANLILGRLNPHSLLGGQMSIFPDKARQAMEQLGEQLHTGTDDAAVSITEIANSMMSKILRIVSIERGFDPRRFALVAFGGAGPMHACALAEELHMSRIVVPPSPGMFSALGLLTADLFHDSKRAIMKRTDALNPSELEKRFQEMEVEGRRTLSAEGVDPRDMRFVRLLDMRYYRQSFELTVEAVEPFDENALRSACSAFHGRHRDVYGYSVEDEPIEVVNALLRAVGLIPRPHPKQLAPSSGKILPRERRRVYFETTSSWEETPVFDREKMRAGDTFVGPAIVEQYDATAVIYPGWGASVDVYGDMILRRRGA